MNTKDEVTPSLNNWAMRGYYVVLFISIAGLLGSLYFSEVLGLIPCLLCWYQRIVLYPLVPLVAIGIVRRDLNLPYYVLPLSIIGIGLALFHVLLQYGVITESLAPCAVGVSCAEKQVAYFGFVTIPLLSLVAFSIITAIMARIVRARSSDDQ